MIICSMLVISCYVDPIQLDYCKMIEEDQLHVNWDKTDMKKFNVDKKKRSSYFRKNFALIMKKTKQDGFPYVDINYALTDSYKYKAATMTMIHTAQSDPNEFFSPKVSKIFKKELDRGNMDKELLRQSTIVLVKTIDLCEEMGLKITNAINLWGIELTILDEAKFINCEL